MYLVIRAFYYLLVFESYLVFGSFAGLHQRVKRMNIKPSAHSDAAIRHICYAVNIACIWYPKRALCLQRAATTTCLLRESGFPAQMVVGAQKLPFKAHAWVELCGAVVNDENHVIETYAVLERC